MDYWLCYTLDVTKIKITVYSTLRCCRDFVTASVWDGLIVILCHKLCLIGRYRQQTQPCSNLRAMTKIIMALITTYKKPLGLPNLTVNPRVWAKCCEEPSAQWEPTQLTGDFWLGVALAICYFQYQNLPQDKL